MKRKKVYTIIAVLLLVILYIVIFCFSAEDGESSSNLSAKVTKMLLKIYYAFTSNKGTGEYVPIDFIYPIEGVVRKVAHFMEYMCVGFLSYSIALMWCRLKFSGSFLIVLQLIISAGLDEFHQYFIPGRNASVKDVFIDVMGGITGMIIIYSVGRIRRWRNTHRQK